MRYKTHHSTHISGMCADWTFVVLVANQKQKRTCEMNIPLGNRACG